MKSVPRTSAVPVVRLVMTISGVAADPPNAIVWRGIGWILTPERHSAWYAARSAAVKVAVPDSVRVSARTWARMSVPEPVFSKPTEPRESSWRSPART